MIDGWLMSDDVLSFELQNLFSAPSPSPSDKHLPEDLASHRERSSSSKGTPSIKETESNKGTSWVFKSLSAWHWQACTNTLPRWAIVTYRQWTSTTYTSTTTTTTTYTNTQIHLPRQKSLNSASALLCTSEGRLLKQKRSPLLCEKWTKKKKTENKTNSSCIVCCVAFGYRSADSPSTLSHTLKQRRRPQNQDFHHCTQRQKDSSFSAVFLLVFGKLLEFYKTHTEHFLAFPIFSEGLNLTNT